MNLETSTAPGRLPRLLQGSRRGPLLRLVGLGLAQGLAAFAVVHFFSRLGSPRIDDPRLLVLPGLALLLGLLKFLEVVEAERLGQAYVRALRRRLVEHLFSAGAASLQRFNRGGLWLRLTSDLNGLRQWISLGVARLVCALPMLVTLGLGLSFTQSRLALVALAAMVLLGLVAFALRTSLRTREAALRRARGKLAGHVDRSLSLLEQDMSTAQREQALQRLRRRGREVAETAVARARLHGVLRGSTEFTVLAMTAAALILSAHVTDAARGELISALALFALLGAPLRDLARAYEMRQSFVVAGTNLRRVFELPAAVASEELSGPPHEDSAGGLLQTKTHGNRS